ncbi:MAG: hypothetical protein HQL48_12010, partial [Gammaproteobacteria bacterium]|nr:hypothetical protein [Gammaproteobacteria bacterium]
LQAWEEGWESRNTPHYLSFYSPDHFQGDEKNFEQWSSHKQRVNANKSYIRLALHEISIFRYPGVEGMVEFTFSQDYQSSNYNKIGRKRLYWQRESGEQWRIIFEGSA